MMKKCLAVFCALAVFAPALVSADESTQTSISYQAKKQGRVAFEKQEPVNPAEIEPAAGEEFGEEEATTESLADKMKLPRKN